MQKVSPLFTNISICNNHLNKFKIVSCSKFKLMKMLSKSKLREEIEKLPDTFSIDELVERLIFIEKIEKGISQSQKREVISETELDNEIAKWFK